MIPAVSFINVFPINLSLLKQFLLASFYKAPFNSLLDTRCFTMLISTCHTRYLFFIPTLQTGKLDHRQPCKSLNLPQWWWQPRSILAAVCLFCSFALITLFLTNTTSLSCSCLCTSGQSPVQPLLTAVGKTSSSKELVPGLGRDSGWPDPVISLRIQAQCHFK